MSARTRSSRRARRRPARAVLGASAAVAMAAVAVAPTAGGAAAAPEGYVSGVVESAAGPEAGVWVIAETEELPTKFVKIVVTDDRGRFVLPQLPDATYDVWVRGYGLVDSPKARLAPTREGVALTAVVAPDERSAARCYPGNYWYSLIEPPAPDEFPGAGPGGNGISPALRSQAAWVDLMKQGCQLCHQLGNAATRVAHRRADFDSAVAAWDHRVRTGQRGDQMSAAMDRFGRERALAMFADWTERIAAGETPPRPPRPSGIERSLVVTLWDWGTDTSFIHDEIATDKRAPTVNADGPVYGVSAGHGTLTVVDPNENRAKEIRIPVRPDDQDSVPSRFPQFQLQPSYYWGEQLLWGRGGPDGRENSSDPHNPMMDARGRVWMTSKVRDRPNPDWRREGSSNRFARYWPIGTSGRQASHYDPENGAFTLIDTCFGTHHLQFDDDDTLWFSGDVNVIGWLDTKRHDATGDEQASQGWCPTVIDTNGDGRITRPWNEPVRGDGGKMDPALDTRIAGFGYGVIAGSTDDAVWITRTGPFPGRLVRLDRGDDPPESCIAEVYEPPSIENPDVDPLRTGSAPRGIDVDSDGVIWTALSGSSHLASFDRRRCRVTNGPEATGRHCPEGWTLYPVPGPQMKGVDAPGSADFHLLQLGRSA